MTTTAHASTPRLKDMVRVEGGRFLMGSEDFYPEERPVHEVAVDGCFIDRHPVTNAQFRRFVKATGYVTVAEQAPDPADYPDAAATRTRPPTPSGPARPCPARPSGSTRPGAA